MSDIAVYLPVSKSSIGLLSPIQRLLSYYRAMRRAAWVEELEKHARAAEYVRASAEALEKAVPGSVARLDENILDVPDPGSCPAAQVYGHYEKTPLELRNGSKGNGFRTAPGLQARHMNLAWQRIICEYRARAA